MAGRRLLQGHQRRAGPSGRRQRAGLARGDDSRRAPSRQPLGPPRWRRVRRPAPRGDRERGGGVRRAGARGDSSVSVDGRRPESDRHRIHGNRAVPLARDHSRGAARSGRPRHVLREGAGQEPVPRPRPRRWLGGGSEGPAGLDRAHRPRPGRRPLPRLRAARGAAERRQHRPLRTPASHEVGRRAHPAAVGLHAVGGAHGTNPRDRSLGRAPRHRAHLRERLCRSRPSDWM